MEGVSLNDYLAAATHAQAMRQMRSADHDIRLQAQQKAAAKGLDATVVVNFDYTIGPDGQLYAAGGTVSSSKRTQGPNEAPLGPLPQLNWRARPTSLADLQAPTPAMDSASFAALFEQNQSSDLSVRQRLMAADAGVRSHERQHFFAAGGLTQGLPVYDLVQGPDGQFYAVGGAVQVRIGGGTPEEQSRDAAALSRAATGPADGSAADIGAANGFMKTAAGKYDQAAALAPQNDNRFIYSIAA
jgi:hypothetical protein